MEESLLQSFSTLPQQERRKFLTELASHFHPSDWWHLDGLLQQQTIYRRFDIVPALPIELAVQVLQYLSLPELFRNRRVSRYWHRILSSDAICRGLALQRFPATSREFILSQKLESHSNIKSWRHLFEDIASRRYFFSKGKYIAYPQLDSLITEFSKLAACSHPRLRLHQENLATWDCRLIFWKHQEVVVCNLHDPAQTMCFPIPNREMISACATHSEFLTVLTSMGKCHTFRMDTGERRTISLESCAYIALIAVTSTVAIIYPTNIIIWEPNTGKSWRVETPVAELGVWIYDLDPVGHVISRIYLDKTACAVWQEQFPYGVRAEECYPKPWALERAPEYPSYTPVATANDNYECKYDIGHSGFCVLQSLRKIAWGRLFSWKGRIMPSLGYDYNKGEWKVRGNIVQNLSGTLEREGSRAYVLEDATVFWSDYPSTGGVDIYLSDEERWIQWEDEEWRLPCTFVEDMSLRHVVILANKGYGRNMEVRRFMGIHERKALEERFRGKVEDAYGTLLKRQ